MTQSLRSIPWTRLLAEGAVIVVSILLAFAIDALWDSAQERSREESYLRQLVSDLESTLANNERFGGNADAIDPAAARLVQSYYEAEPPSRDSLLDWLDQAGYWVVQPRLGTVEALVQSGDLVLIRDDLLRTALPAYLANMRAFEDFEAVGEQNYRDAATQLALYIDPVRITLEARPASAGDPVPLSSMPAGPARSLPPLDIERIVRTPEVHAILHRMLLAKRQMGAYRGLMKRESENLLVQVRSAQAR